VRPVGVVAPSSKSKPSSFRAHLKRAGGGAVAGIGQFRPVAVDAQSSMKWTFRIASIHRASGDAVRASCIGTTVFAALVGPLAPLRRHC
jgi:hypothetical protein